MDVEGQERVKMLRNQFDLVGYIRIVKAHSLSRIERENVFMLYQYFP